MTASSRREALVEVAELAERCEAATGDDAMSRTMRALNADILRATGWREAEGDVIDPAGNLRVQVPFYVGSLDAAMTLLKGDWHHFEVCPPQGKYTGWTVHLIPPQRGIVNTITAYAATYPLALTAAALRAIAATGAAE